MGVFFIQNFTGRRLVSEGKKAFEKIPARLRAILISYGPNKKRMPVVLGRWKNIANMLKIGQFR
jgi:hypothetical protein